VELRITFDDRIARSYVERGASPLMYIHWDFGHMQYPSDDWMDFGAVIVPWWLVNSHDMILGSEGARFSFMDGPYSIVAKRDDSQLRLSFRGQPDIVAVAVLPFIDSLLTAARALCRELDRRGINNGRIDFGVQELKAACEQSHIF
jgi:hypothetical protein